MKPIAASAKAASVIEALFICSFSYLFAKRTRNLLRRRCLAGRSADRRPLPTMNGASVVVRFCSDEPPGNCVVPRLNDDVPIVFFAQPSLETDHEALTPAAFAPSAPHSLKGRPV